MQSREITNILKKDGHRITKARKAIVALLGKSNNPQSIPQLITKLNKKRIDVNKTTVYREMHFLLKKGFVEFCTLDSNTKQYKLTTKKKQRAHCVKCNTYVDVCDEFEKALRNLKKSLGQKNHFKLENQALHLHGICQHCQAI